MSNTPKCQVSYRSSVKVFNAIGMASMVLSVILLFGYAAPPVLDWHRDWPYDARKHYLVTGILHPAVFSILLVMTPQCNCDLHAFDDVSVDYCDDSDLIEAALPFLLVLGFIWLFWAYKTHKAVVERRRNTTSSDNMELAAMGALEGYFVSILKPKIRWFDNSASYLILGTMTSAIFE